MPTLDDEDNIYAGTSANDITYALAGNDRLYGRTGNDQLNGGDGNDRIYGEEDDDILYGGAGDDILNGGTGNDIIYGDAGSDRVVGGTGTDEIHGGADADRIYGNEDADTIYGDGGGDYLDGGDGDDTIYGGDDGDRILGQTGNDTLYGDGGRDRLEGGDGDDILNGGDDNDRLLGEAGNDTINGDAGDDRLEGGDGNDTLNGGSGRDFLLGGIGNDILDGGDDNDTLHGEDGADTINGGLGNDKIFGGNDDDIINGGDGADRIEGDAGNDTIYGDGGNDRILGEDGNDTLDGGLGHDVINGGLGDDTLIGGEGNDQLRGEAGADSLSGGLGNDLLIYDADNILMDGGDGYDTITVGGGFAGNIDASDAMFANIEAIDLTGYAVTPDIALANNLTIRVNDVKNLSSNNQIFVSGDAGLDTITSSQFGLNDQVGIVTRGGIEYAQLSQAGANLFVQVGLEINGQVVLGTPDETVITGTKHDDVLISESVPAGSNPYVQDILDNNPNPVSGSGGSQTLIYNADTGNFYQYVFAFQSEGQMNDAIANGTINGIAGHLVTFETDAELNFVLDNLGVDYGGGATFQNNTIVGDSDTSAAVVTIGPITTLNADGSFNSTSGWRPYIVEFEGDDILGEENNTPSNGEAYTLIGGGGNDELYGADGMDIFVFEDATAFGNKNRDVIFDFDQTDGDVIDISDILSGQGIIVDASNIDQYVQIDQYNGIRVDTNGNGQFYGGNSNPIATFSGSVDIINGDEAALLANGNLLI